MTTDEIAIVTRLVAQQLDAHAQVVDAKLAEHRATTVAARRTGEPQTTLPTHLVDQLHTALSDCLRRSLTSRDARVAELEARLTVAERRLTEGGAR